MTWNKGNLGENLANHLEELNKHLDTIFLEIIETDKKKLEGLIDLSERVKDAVEKE